MTRDVRGTIRTRLPRSYSVAQIESAPTATPKGCCKPEVIALPAGIVDPAPATPAFTCGALLGPSPDGTGVQATSRTIKQPSSQPILSLVTSGSPSRRR